MSSFQNLGVFVHNNPEAKAQRRVVQRIRVTSLGLCLRVILNEQNTISSVLSVLLLIYD